MSEQAPQFNPLDQAKLIADGNDDYLRFIETFGNKAGVISPRTASDIVEYFESRPGRGSADNFISDNNAEQAPDHEEVNNPNNKSTEFAESLVQPILETEPKKNRVSREEAKKILEPKIAEERGDVKEQEPKSKKYIPRSEARARLQGLLNEDIEGQVDLNQESKKGRISREEAKIRLSEKIASERADAQARSYDSVRSRVDDVPAKKWMMTLKNAGVPDEILQDFPAEFFYKDGDPDQIDDIPESFKEWLVENPDALKENDEVSKLEARRDELLKERDDLIAISSSLQSKPSKTKEGKWKSRLSQFMTQEGAVTFDKNGNAHVDVDREAWSNKKIAGVLLGLGAVAALGAGIAHFYSTKDTALLAGAMGDGSDKISSPSNVLTLASNLEDVKQITENVTTTINQGDGVSQIVQNMLESKGVKGLDPEQMKNFIDGAINKDLLNPENVSGLVKMDVYGGYGFPSTGNTSFSPAFIDYMNQFRETLEETTKAKA